MDNGYIKISHLKTSLERANDEIDSVDQKTELLSAISEGIDTRVTSLELDIEDLDIPTKTSELTNDAKFQTDVDVAAAVANADRLTRRKITSLSDIDLTADDADQYIYMLPITDVDGNTYYQQYMVIDGVAEAMGTTKIDLEGYLTEDDVATDAEVDEGIGEGLDFSTFSMPICVNKNLFRNGILLNPVNQRGKDSYTGIGYGFDGWYAYHDDTTVAKSNEGLVVTNSVNSSNAVVGQIIPTSDLILGEYTLSALSTGGFNNVEVWSGSRKLFEAPSDKFFSKKINIDSTWTHSQIRFNFYMKPGSKFVGAKLERGDRQTFVYKDIYGNLSLTECPDFGAELSACMKDLIEFVNPCEPDYGFLGIGSTYNKQVNVFIPVPVRFKRRPSVSFSGKFKLFQSGSWAQGIDVKSVTVDRVTTTTVVVAAFTENALTSGLWAFAYTPSPAVRNSLLLSDELLPA